MATALPPRSAERLGLSEKVFELSPRGYASKSEA